MPKTMTFNQLRRIKDNLPEGAMHQIAEKLNLEVATVRNYFGGANYREGQHIGVHMEPGPDGGIVYIEDTTILDMAADMLEMQEKESKIFEWHENKNQININKHGIDFYDAQMIFEDEFLLATVDDRYDYGERRWKAIGNIYGSIFSVIYTFRGINTIRIISARRASEKERNEYNRNKI